jgi:hypothetical protein
MTSKSKTQQIYLQPVNTTVVFLPNSMENYLKINIKNSKN